LAKKMKKAAMTVRFPNPQSAIRNPQSAIEGPHHQHIATKTSIPEAALF